MQPTSKTLVVLLLTKEATPFRKYNADYVCVLCTQVDGLCQWVMEMREEVIKNENKVLVAAVQQGGHRHNRNEQHQAQVHAHVCKRVVQCTWGRDAITVLYVTVALVYAGNLVENHC